jgi:hypothetical protein
MELAECCPLEYVRLDSVPRWCAPAKVWVNAGALEIWGRYVNVCCLHFFVGEGRDLRGNGGGRRKCVRVENVKQGCHVSTTPCDVSHVTLPRKQFAPFRVEVPFEESR